MRTEGLHMVEDAVGVQVHMEAVGGQVQLADGAARVQVDRLDPLLQMRHQHIRRAEVLRLLGRSSLGANTATAARPPRQLRGSFPCSVQRVMKRTWLSPLQQSQTRCTQLGVLGRLRAACGRATSDWFCRNNNGSRWMKAILAGIRTLEAAHLAQRLGNCVVALARLAAAPGEGAVPNRGGPQGLLLLAPALAVVVEVAQLERRVGASCPAVRQRQQHRLAVVPAAPLRLSSSDEKHGLLSTPSTTQWPSAASDGAAVMQLLPLDASAVAGLCITSGTHHRSWEASAE